MDRSFVAANDAARARLIALVNRLSEEDLRRRMPAGWTVSAVFAHIAFWDARALYFINKWEGGIPPSEADMESGDVDWVNNSAKPLCLALPPRAAADLAVQLAEETDRRVAGMSDTLIEQMLAIGQPFYLARAEHRTEHLDEIEQALR